MIRALLFILAAAPAWADHPARLLPGDFVIMSHDWNHETDTWDLADPKVATSCWEVTARTEAEIAMVLRAGAYHPWWSDAPKDIGFSDAWIGNSDAYLEAHPDAPPFELTEGLFTTVPDCEAK